jgi:Tripartite tricarboxylate transporter TctB family
MSEPSPGAGRSASGMVKRDFVSGLAFVALGIATVVESLRMPAFAELEAEFYTAPGIVPGLLGAGLALLGALLSLHAAAGQDRGQAATAGADHAWPQVGAAFALCMVYAGVLVSRIPFQLATFLFIVAFILTFELWDARLRARWRRQTIIAVALAALLAFGISYLFEAIFLIRLP